MFGTYKKILLICTSDMYKIVHISCTTMGSIFVISLKGKAIPQSGAFEKMLAKMSLVKRLEA